MDLSLFTLQLWRPTDTKDLHIVFTIGQDCVALLSTWTVHCVVNACWEKGTAQELVDVWRAAQFDQWHKWLEREKGLHHMKMYLVKHEP